ncbi:MAG: ImmA/IrrE family metallo-endopeptidase [Acidobacteria bacterium]|nr:ImmA/IrrE family metallo-endopeptidase [Acidobacteriota bacterium]
MTELAEVLRAACQAAGTSGEVFASLAGVDHRRFEAAAEGRGELDFPEVDRCARVLGLRVADLLAGLAGTAPLGMLLRSSVDEGLDIRALLVTEVHEALGEFLRVARDIADLERLLGVVIPELPRLGLLPAEPDEHPGERAARTLRAALDLGVEPVPSMRGIVEGRFHIRVIWVTEDQVDRALDGACTVDPRPAILVNLLEPERYPWRTRITLAHELCHLLFDVEASTRRAVFSPHHRRRAGAEPRARLPAGLEEIEQRARAFAACFLAPAAGVRAAVGSAPPTTETAIRKVGERFGVGRVVAINRLQHVFGLADSDRFHMETRLAEPYEADFAGDDVDVPLGLHGGALPGLVCAAVAGDRIGAVRARRILGLEPTDPLPFAELDAARARPLVARAEVMRRAAERILMQRWPEAGLLAAAAHEDDGGWRVEVVGGGVGARQPAGRGYLVLSGSGELLAFRVDPTPPA